MLGIIFRTIPIIGLIFVIAVFVVEAQKAGNEKEWGNFFLWIFEIACMIYIFYEWIRIFGWA